MSNRVETPVITDEQMKDMDSIVEVLEDLSYQEGTELGELWGHLCSLWNSYTDYSSDVFVNALEKEIREHAEYLRDNVKLIEEDREIPARTIREKEFDWGHR